MILIFFLILLYGGITDLGATSTTADVNHRKKTRAKTGEYVFFVLPELRLVLSDLKMLHLEGGEGEKNCLGQRVCQKKDG